MKKHKTKIRKNRYKKSAARTKKTGTGRLRVVLLSVFSALLLAGFSAGLVFTHDMIIQSPYFAGLNFSVEGNRQLSKADVLKQAGIGRGRNILSIKLGLAKKRLEAHPWISRAEVIRQLPSDVIIRIKEHTVIAAADFGDLFLMNEDGDLFKKAVEGDPATLTVVRGMAYRDIDPDRKSDTIVFSSVMEILNIAGRNKNSQDRDAADLVLVDREMGLTISGMNGFKEAKLGYENYSGKMNRLKRICTYFKGKEIYSTISSIDLTDLNRVVVTPGELPETASAHPLKES